MTQLPQTDTEQDHTPSYYPADDAIDLREYILTLGRWWREILLITVLTALAAAAVVLGGRYLSKPVYEAAATVAIVRTKSEVSFDERFVTQSDEVTASSTANTSARRGALVGLVSSGIIAQDVIATLGDTLNEEQKIPTELLEGIEAELISLPSGRGESDLIVITATADTPAKAAAIVNAWAAAYVERVNAVYGQTPSGLVTSIGEEVDEIQATYDVAQTNLEVFVQDNDLDHLNRIIAEKQATINSLQAAKQAALTDYIDEIVNGRKQTIQTYLNARTQNELLVFNTEQEGRRALVSAYMGAVNNARLLTFTEQKRHDEKLLSEYYEESRSTSAHLEDARSLKMQVEQGGSGAVATNALALQLLKTQVFADVTELPSILQVQLGDLSVLSLEEVLADLGALIDVLEKRASTLESGISELSNKLLSGDGYSHLAEEVPTDSDIVDAITTLQAELLSSSNLFQLSDEQVTSGSLPDSGDQGSMTDFLQLTDLEDFSDLNASVLPLNQNIDALQREIQLSKAQFEAERSRQLQLKQNRDLAWTTLVSLRNKIAELKLSAAAANSEVRLAAQAIAPVDPVPGPGLIRTVFLAAVVGFMLGVGIAFFADYMGVEPFLGRSEKPSPEPSI